MIRILFYKEQLNDDKINLVKRYLNTKDIDILKIYKRHLSRLKIEGDILMFGRGGKLFFVVPKSLRDEVLLLGHTQFAAWTFRSR